MMVCTEPLPKVRVPIRVARLWSRKAPATISEAEAEPPLISTTSGLPFVMSPPRAVKRWVSSAVRPQVETTSPRDMKALDTENRVVEQSAGIVAEVDDIARELVGGDLLRNAG